MNQVKRGRVGKADDMMDGSVDNIMMMRLKREKKCV